MALRIAIDANRYADFFRGVEAAVRPIREAQSVYLPFIVLAEIRAGFKHGNHERENERNLQEFLKAHHVTVLFADEATTHFYAQIYLDLRRAGTPIPTNDIWIAALVIQHDLVLVTRDRHFEAVPRMARM